jgi:hypothetical protein
MQERKKTGSDIRRYADRLANSKGIYELPAYGWTVLVARA